jgi:hypothetical protein
MEGKSARGRKGRLRGRLFFILGEKLAYCQKLADLKLFLRARPTKAPEPVRAFLKKM